MKYIGGFLEFFIIIGIGALLVNNYNSEMFFQSTLVNILTLSIAFFITYWLKGNKERNKQLFDNVASIITEIEQLIREEDMFSDNDVAALTCMTACVNRIGYLKKYAKNIDIKNFNENIESINEWFTEMRGYYSPSKEVREKKQPRTQKLRELIIAKCIDIRLAIYTMS